MFKAYISGITKYGSRFEQWSAYGFDKKTARKVAEKHAKQAVEAGHTVVIVAIRKVNPEN